MKKQIRRLAALMLALLLVSGGVFASAETAAETPATPAATAEDSGIIDAEELNAWMDSFLEERGLNRDYIIVSVGFWYSGTGDSWYYNADEFMYSASMYKVPVAMLMAEKEAAGELTPQSVCNGTTLEFLESTALVYSNNDSGHSMVTWLGGTFNGKCADMATKFTDLPEDYFVPNFNEYSYYSARFMTQVMRTLYLGGDEKFPHLIDYLKAAQPNEYFNRDPALKDYEVAQKFGAYKEPNGNDNNHCTAIIFTPKPIVVTVMTRNAADYQNLIASIGGHLADYALKLDQKLAERAAAEAAQAEEAARAAAAAETAAGDVTITMPAPETESASIVAEGGTESTSPAPEAAPSGETPSVQPAKKGLPTAVIVVAAVILVLLALALAALAVLRRRAEEWQEDEELHEEEEETFEEEPDVTAEAELPPEPVRQPERPAVSRPRPRETDETPRNPQPKKRPAPRQEYKPKH